MDSIRLRVLHACVCAAFVTLSGCVLDWDKDVGAKLDDELDASGGTGKDDETPDAGPPDTQDPDSGRPDPQKPDASEDPRACATGTWDHDADSATECLAWSTCAVGTYVSQSPSATGDRLCTPCTSGSFSALENAASCEPWTTCQVGSYVSVVGTESADQVCEACEEGTLSTVPNQASCIAADACQAGSVQTEAATPASPAVCEPCEVGTYCAGEDAPKRACASGTWDHDSNPGTACVAWTNCAAGQSVANPGSAVVNRTCTACGSGTYSTAANAAQCVAWTNCAPGTFVQTAGTTSSNRVCAACGPNTYSSSANQTSCTAASACAAGSVQTAAATATAPAVCTACGEGTYCAGGTAASQPCANGTWDHDGNPATACVPRKNCVAGQAVSSNGDATTDRACTACASGSFRTAINAASCAPWSDCAAGTRVSTAGSTTNNRVCEACPTGTYTSSSNQTTCTPAGQCAAGTVQTAPATATSPATCAACTTAGTYCAGGTAPSQTCPSGTWDHDTNSATPCSAWRTCVAGEYVGAPAASATVNRTCTTCTSGFTTGTNATSCTTWANCTGRFYMSAAGTATANRQCTRCAYGQTSVGTNGTTCSVIPSTIGVGWVHACAIAPSNGNVQCWGTNDAGQLGDGTNTSRATPVFVIKADGSRLANVVELVARQTHTCARLTDGTVYCWGGNLDGEVGNGTKVNQTRAQQVQNLSGVVVASLATGSVHTCARLSTGQVRCWGGGSEGQLGNGKMLDSLTPVPVSNISNAVEISAMGPFSCARLATGSVQCWGANRDAGQLGNGGTADSALPVTISGGLSVAGVQSGTSHSCVRRTSDNRVFCWGDNTYGQLGDGTTVNRLVPKEASGSLTATALSAGSANSCGIQANGTARCWGDNSSGQFGNGNTMSSTTAVNAVINVTGIEEIVLGFAAACARLASNEVYCWGSNFYGQLGQTVPGGPGGQSLTPLLINFKAP